MSSIFGRVPSAPISLRYSEAGWTQRRLCSANADVVARQHAGDDSGDVSYHRE
jgi:hypothetical protein